MTAPTRPPIPLVGLDERAMAAARDRQAQLLKPPGSLGALEELAIWLAGCTGGTEVRARVVIAAADRDGAVSAYPSDVTRQMVAAFTGGRSAVTVLAREVGADVVVVDAGVRGEPSPGVARIEGLRPARDLAVEAALSTGEVAAAVDAGRALARRARADGITVLVGGEMGIGNTTNAAALAQWLTGRDGLAGPGTGLDRQGVAHKQELVDRALARHAGELRGPLGALKRLGSGEIAVLAGLALGAGEHGLAYVCDGVIATAAAAIAVAVEPGLRPRLLAGHRSPEPAHAALLEHLGLTPVLDLGMRLGEGSGATAALAVLRLAAAAHDGMATFAEAGVSR